jgi:hypothetical protein
MCVYVHVCVVCVWACVCVHNMHARMHACDRGTRAPLLVYVCVWCHVVRNHCGCSFPPESLSQNSPSGAVEEPPAVNPDQADFANHDFPSPSPSPSNRYRTIRSFTKSVSDWGKTGCVRLRRAAARGAVNGHTHHDGWGPSWGWVVVAPNPPPPLLPTQNFARLPRPAPRLVRCRGPRCGHSGLRPLGGRTRVVVGSSCRLPPV